MSYKLLDQNGNYMEINGMHKGTIVSPYEYQGMELYNENYINSNKAPFYSMFWGASRRVKIGSSYYYPSNTNKEYVDEAYSATEITITGKYSNSSYKNYEVYKDGNLVASGSFTNSNTDIYVCQKEANTSIIVRGIWDETNSKFIYNITTNATIERNHSYNWNNGILTTSTLTKNGTIAGYGTSKTVGITVPSEEDIFSMLPSDSIIISATYSTVFTAKNLSSNGYKVSLYFRTDYDNSTSIITTLPGSSLGSILNLGYNQSGSFTRNDTSYLGKTYYLYYHSSNWSSNQYHNLNTSMTSIYSISSTTTATVKYRYFDEVHTAIVNVTRTNAYTLPSYSINQVKEMLPSFGTSTVNSFKYHYTMKNNASSGSYTYYRIKEGSSVKASGSLSLGSTRTRYFTYIEDMPSILALQMSTASDGTFTNGSDSYISFTKEEGSQYLEISYTWTPE